MLAFNCELCATEVVLSILQARARLLCRFRYQHDDIEDLLCTIARLSLFQDLNGLAVARSRGRYTSTIYCEDGNAYEIKKCNQNNVVIF